MTRGQKVEMDGETKHVIESKELIDLCLNCRRKQCRGRCPEYSELARKQKVSDRKDKAGNPIGGRGYAPKRYPFRGKMISIPEFALLVGKGPTTIRKRHNNGETLEEIYAYYAHKAISGAVRGDS